MLLRNKCDSLPSVAAQTTILVRRLKEEDLKYESTIDTLVRLCLKNRKAEDLVQQ